MHRANANNKKLALAPKPNSQPGEQKTIHIGSLDDSVFQFKKFFVFIAIVLASIAFAIFLFTSGFLLKRQALEFKSTCDSIKPSHASADSAQKLHIPDIDAECWSTPKFKKAVILVIDALRFDFALWDQEYEDSTKTNSTTTYYTNKLPILHTLTTSQPENALLFKFKADPPTTTLQRLKALTTGTLPTFIDAGSNFHSTQIHEDNIIKQLQDAGKRLVFMGDDTWMGLYPDEFEHAYPYPSLNVWDLHTVDNGVLSHLYDYLNNPASFEVLVAHYLGVDHAGHRYGPNHPEMGAKLTQMNEMLQQVVDLIDEDTLLMVMGDHGMDRKGDHGGDSDMELNAALFMYSKQKLTSRSSNNHRFLSDIIKEFTIVEDTLGFDRTKENYRTVSQIDIVPTLSLLLGIPIPFENLGAIIPELFLHSPSDTITASRINAFQVMIYLESYYEHQKTNDLSLETMQHLVGMFKDAELTYRSGEYDEKEMLIQYLTFVRTALASCRKVWAQFDVPLMITGVLVLFLTLVGLVTFAMVDSRMPIPTAFTFCPITSLGAITGLALTRTLWVFVGSTLDSNLLRWHAMIAGAFIGGWSLYITQVIRHKLSRFNIPFHLSSIFALTLIIIHSAMFVSDSFIIHEDSVITYLLQSLIIVVFISGIRLSDDSKSITEIVLFCSGLLLTTRFSAASTICREEQLPYCHPTFYDNPSSSTSSPIVSLLSVVVNFGMAMFVRWVVDRSDALYTTHAVLIKYLLPVALWMVNTYWLLDGVDSWVSSSNVLVFIPVSFLHDIKIPWARYGCLSAILAYFTVWVKSGTTASMKVIKNTAQQQEGQPKRATVCLVGLANSVGGPLLVFVLGLVLVVTMLLKPTGSVVLALGITGLLCLLELAALYRHKGYKPILLWTSIVYFMSHHYFFRTGHQSTLQSIDWSIGFVGIEDVNYYLSPILISLNFWGPFLVFGASVPLLVLWKYGVLRGLEQHIWRDLLAVVSSFMCLGVLDLVVNVASVMHLRRHLMVWKVFAPRFMLASVNVLVVIVACAVGLGASIVGFKGLKTFLNEMNGLKNLAGLNVQQQSAIPNSDTQVRKHSQENGQKSHKTE